MGEVVRLAAPRGDLGEWFDTPEALDAERAQGRELPQRESRKSPIGERALLGVLLRHPEQIPAVAAIVGPRAFTVTGHAALFEALVALHRETGGVDLESLLARVRATPGAFTALGGGDGIVSLAELHAATRSEALATARRLAEYAAAREMELIGTALYRAARDWSRPIATVRAEALKHLAAVSVGATVPGVLGDELDALVARMEAVAAGEAPARGVEMGLRDLDAATDGLTGLTVLGSRPGLGKAQPLYAKVLTPRGFVPMGELRVGDEVIGVHGHPARVLGVFPQGTRPVFRVTFSDGGATECCAEHLWFTQTRNERRRGLVGAVRSLAEIRATLRIEHGQRSNHHIPLVGMVDFAPTAPTRLHPYALGLLLGDGGLSSGAILHNPEPDVQQRFAAVLPPEDEAPPPADGITCRVRRRQRNNERSETAKALAYYGLAGADSFTKFIPADYLLGSREDRIALLRGLVDADGYVCDGGRSIEYVTTSARLAADLAFLVRSLGGIATPTTKIPRYSYLGETRTGALAHRIGIRFPHKLVPVSSIKHLARWRGGVAFPGRAIVAVTPVGEVPCQCILVDAPDHLYVTDDFAVTHNTSMALQAALHVAATQGPVFYASLEMPRGELARWALAHLARVDARRLRVVRDLTPEDMARLAPAADRLRDLPLIVRDRTPATVADIAAEATEVLRTRGALSLVVVDTLRKVRSSRRFNEVRDAFSEVVGDLKELTKPSGINVPILLLAHIGRDIGKAGNLFLRPRIEHLSGSSAIEAEADAVLLLHSEHHYPTRKHDKPVPSDLVEITAAKQRHGARGATVELRHHASTITFEDLEGQDDMPLDDLGPADSEGGYAVGGWKGGDRG